MFSFVMQDVPKIDSSRNSIGVFACDYSFADLFDLTFLSGMNFSANSSDEMEKGEYIINEIAMKYLGFQDPNIVVGKAFAILSPVERVNLSKGRIIGVVKDFHLFGLQTKVEPLALFKRADSWLGNIVLVYKLTLKNEAILTISKIWSSLFPKYPLEYIEVSTLYKNVYNTEKK